MLAASIVGIAVSNQISALDQVAVVTLLSGVAVWICSLGAGTSNGPCTRALGWLSDRSYSPYLCHLPCFLTVREIMIRAGMRDHWDNAIGISVGFPLGIITALVLFEATFRFVETPLSKFGRGLANRRAATTGRAQLPLQPL